MNFDLHRVRKWFAEPYPSDWFVSDRERMRQKRIALGYDPGDPSVEEGAPPSESPRRSIFDPPSDYVSRQRAALGYGDGSWSPVKSDSTSIYGIGFLITAIVVFFASWIYCVSAYGYLLGVGLGWLPSIIVAVIAGLLWPLAAIAALVLLYFST